MGLFFSCILAVRMKILIFYVIGNYKILVLWISARHPALALLFFDEIDL